MRRFFEALGGIIKFRVDAFAEDTAEALEEGDKLHLLKNAIILAVMLLAIIGGGAALLGLLYLGRKFLLALIGVPTMAALLVKSYHMNKEDHVVLHAGQEERVLLEERAKSLYGYVRDGIFLMLRAVSDYTVIIRPRSPSAIETRARICILDGVAIYQFKALISEEIKDMPEFRETLDQALGQMLRNRELPGLPSKLVTIGNKNYPPVQILALADLGSSVNIDVVFSNEKSVAMIERQRLLDLEDQKKAEVPYDADF